MAAENRLTTDFNPETTDPRAAAAAGHFGPVPWQPPKALAPPKRSRAGTVARTAFALGVLAVGGVFVHDRFVGLNSEAAVLTGVMMVVRAPIDGRFDASAPLEPGTVLAPAAAVGVVKNERADTGKLNDLTAAAALRGEVEATKARMEGVDRAVESAGGDAFRRARVEQLGARVREAEAGITAAKARVREADAALERSEALLATRAGTAAAAEQARRAQAVAANDAEVATQRRAGALTELAAARAGVYATDVASDRSASQQATDRLKLLRAEISAQLGERANRLAAVERQIEGEKARIERFGTAVLTAGASGRSRVVHQHTQDGEHVRQGQTIAELTDCTRPVVVAVVDENRFRSLRLGMEASFTPGGALTRLNHDAPKLEGRVVQLLTPLAPRGVPGDEKYRAVLQVRPSSVGDACETGVTGRVAFRT